MPLDHVQAENSTNRNKSTNIPALLLYTQHAYLVSFFAADRK